MFYDHHFMGMHWVWWIILTVVLLLMMFNIIPYSTNNGYREEAIDILKKRFARGEIEREEYEERKRIIEDNSSD